MILSSLCLNLCKLYISPMSCSKEFHSYTLYEEWPLLVSFECANCWLFMCWRRNKTSDPTFSQYSGGRTFLYLKLRTCLLESSQALDKHGIKLMGISYTSRWKFRKSEAFFFPLQTIPISRAFIPWLSTQHSAKACLISSHTSLHASITQISFLTFLRWYFFPHCWSLNWFTAPKHNSDALWFHGPFKRSSMAMDMEGLFRSLHLTSFDSSLTVLHLPHFPLFVFSSVSH